MASPGNQHCASCIGTLSFPISCHGEQKLVFLTSDGAFSSFSATPTPYPVHGDAHCRVTCIIK